jgi:hypothetical protein
VHPDFRLKAVLSFVGRDDTGAPMADSRHNWYWKGTLVNFSEEGARMRMGPGVRAELGDTCDLVLTIVEDELRIPCEVMNIAHEEDATFFGLRHVASGGDPHTRYRRLVAGVAIGSSLVERARGNAPDESGYYVDQYLSDHGARLTIWRHPQGRVAVAFELVIPDGVVRGATGMHADYLDIGPEGTLTVAPIEKAKEIHQIFEWITPNLNNDIPQDVRGLLKSFA